MLLKVFRYFIKSSIKPVTIISACIPVVAVIVSLSIRLGGFWAGSNATSRFIVMMFGWLIVIVLSAPFIIGSVLLRNNLKDFTTDRAYLIFTLPIKPHEHILGRYFSLILQMAIVVAAEYIGIVLGILCLGDSNITEVVSGLNIITDFKSWMGIESAGVVWDTIFAIEKIFMAIELVSVIIIGSMTFGLFYGNEKRKVSKYIISFIICYFSILIISTIISAISEYVYGSGVFTTLSYQVVNLATIVIYAVVILLLYFISVSKIKNAVNLE